MGASELVSLFGIERQNVDELTGLAGLPTPTDELPTGPTWIYADVLEWAHATGHAVHRNALQHPPMDARVRAQLILGLLPVVSLILLYSLLHWAARLDVVIGAPGSGDQVHQHAGLLMEMAAIAGIPSLITALFGTRGVRIWGIVMVLACLGVGRWPSSWSLAGPTSPSDVVSATRHR